MSEQVHDERNLAGAIYGTILATSVVAGLSEGGQVEEGHAGLVVLATSAVFWLAHAYAAVLGQHLGRGHGLTWSRVRGIAAHEWPILTSAIPPAVLLGLGELGLYGRDTAYSIEIGAAILSLVLWGVAYAREQGYSLAGVLLTGAFNGALGLLIVGLKVAVH